MLNRSLTQTADVGRVHLYPLLLTPLLLLKWRRQTL